MKSSKSSPPIFHPPRAVQCVNRLICEIMPFDIQDDASAKSTPSRRSFALSAYLPQGIDSRNCAFKRAPHSLHRIGIFFRPRYSGGEVFLRSRVGYHTTPSAPLFSRHFAVLLFNDPFRRLSNMSAETQARSKTSLIAQPLKAGGTERRGGRSKQRGVNLVAPVEVRWNWTPLVRFCAN